MILSYLNILKNPKTILNIMRNTQLTKKKFFLSANQIGCFLQETDSFYSETSLIFKFLIEYILRVHAISNLKLKHLLYLTKDNNIIRIPYTRSNKIEKYCS